MTNLNTNKTNIITSILTMAYRNLLKTLHNPDNILDVVIQPILFMIMFSYLFGTAISGDIHAYLPTIVPGILMQSLISAASGSGIQINDDIHSGIYDRLKSLPIAHIAPLAGQLLADILRLSIAALVSVSTGYLMGWRPNAGFGWVMVVIALAIFLGWALGWVFALYGLLAKSSTMVESVSLMTMLILSFLSTAFVPINKLPHPMQIIVNLNPITYVIKASHRMLDYGIWSSDAWIVLGAGIIVICICAPLTVLAYNRKD